MLTPSVSLDATLVAELLVFALVFLITAKVVLPRLRAAMAARRAEIEAALAEAGEARQRLVEVEAECERMLADARRQARQTLSAYQRMGQQVLADARDQAGAQERRAAVAAPFTPQ